LLPSFFASAFIHGALDRCEMTGEAIASYEAFGKILEMTNI
jgi:hypothetical protein